MFTRIKKSGQNAYLQICRSVRQGNKVKQQVVVTLGRLDQLQTKGEIEKLVRSLAKYSEKILLVLSSKSDIKADSYKIGPPLIFERLWQESGIKAVITSYLQSRYFTFAVERALFLVVLHRLIVSGSDRFCNRWRRDYRIAGIEDLQLHHLYRAMAWLGEELLAANEEDTLGPRCVKDLIEEALFKRNRDLFSSLDLVFFDTTSLYFEGEGGESLGHLGHSKDHRPDLNQMIVGAVLDNNGRPISCEMWKGNTADVTTLIPVIDRLRKRFGIKNFCIVADRGMISDKTITALEDRKLSYILGVRMRKVKNVRLLIAQHQDLSTYEQVREEREESKAPAPLSVKEVKTDVQRNVICYNSRQARKDKAAREAILEDLKERIKSNVGSLIGNKGYRKYLKVVRGSVAINEKKIESEAMFDGKWVLQTNMNWSAKEIALKYKELWQVEHVFRDTKSLLDTRPIFHQKDRTIRGHVFCSFLALVLRKELEQRLGREDYDFEWSQIKQDLCALQEIIIEDNGKKIAVRSECQGVCSKIFQSVGVAIPPTIREI